VLWAVHTCSNCWKSIYITVFIRICLIVVFFIVYAELHSAKESAVEVTVGVAALTFKKVTILLAAKFTEIGN
jgi:archaellum biogenesis protein FlaJ (TadC family)